MDNQLPRLGYRGRSLDECVVNTRKKNRMDNGAPQSQRRMNTKPAVRQSRFVIACLTFHAVITLLCFSSLRHHGVGTLIGTVYVIYFVYTSMPSVFVGPLLPDDARTSVVFTMFLIVNGVLVVWLTANWMYGLFAGSEDKASEP